MTLLDSLIDAVMRLDGDSLVMHAGEKPYVVTGIVGQGVHQGPVLWGQVEISSRILTSDTLRSMLPQLLEHEHRQAFDEIGAVDFETPALDDRPAFKVIVAQGGDDVWLEVKRVKPTLDTIAEAPVADEPAVDAPPESAAASIEPLTEAGVSPADRQVLVEHTIEPAAIEEAVFDEAEPAVPVALENVDAALAEESNAMELEVVPDEMQQIPSEDDVDALLAATASALLTDLRPAPIQPDVAATIAVDPAPAPVADPPAAERIAVADAVAAAIEQQPQAQTSEPMTEPSVASRVDVADEVQVEANVQVVPAPALFAIEPRAAQPASPASAPDPLAASLPKSIVPASSHIRDLLIAASELGASAMYVVAHSRPMVRIDGEIVPLEGADVLSNIDVDGLREFLTAQQATRRSADADWHWDMDRVGRVRYLLFQDHRGPGVIFRMLPARSLSAEKLGLPAAVQALAAQTDGLVLVAGAPGSGRTTMLSAYLEQINSTRSDHVIAVATQISFVHESRRSFVSQREAGAGADAMAAAVRQAVAEDPDVLFVDDVASAAVAEVVVDASSRGRLVFASIEAPSSTAALERIVEMFPGERRAQARATLAESLRGVVSQVMLRRAAGGRVAARELLINAPSVAAVLLEGKTLQVPAVIESGRRIGMIPLSDSLADLVRNGVVHAGEAYRKAVDRDALLAALKAEGIDTSFAERLA